jgi:hypothetical protein
MTPAEYLADVEKNLGDDNVISSSALGVEEIDKYRDLLSAGYKAIGVSVEENCEELSPSTMRRIIFLQAFLVAFVEHLSNHMLVVKGLAKEGLE